MQQHTVSPQDQLLLNNLPHTASIRLVDFFLPHLLNFENPSEFGFDRYKATLWLNAYVSHFFQIAVIDDRAVISIPLAWWPYFRSTSWTSVCIHKQSDHAHDLAVAPVFLTFFASDSQMQPHAIAICAKVSNVRLLTRFESVFIAPTLSSDRPPNQSERSMLSESNESKIFSVEGLPWESLSSSIARKR